MSLSGFGRTLFALALFAPCLSARFAWAQATVVPAGVMVDADGVLRHQTRPDPTGAVQRERVAAARAALGKLAGSSPLRKVSLHRLEAALQARLDQHQAPSDEMLKLAGLTRVKYVFYYPESRDIVLAGPAEGWFTDPVGRVRGMESGRPIVELQDLVTALRAYAPAGKKTGVVMCSIDPTPEGLAAMQQFLREFGRRATPADTETIVEGLRSSLGMQNIRVGGVPATTHLAQVLVEADYRMKLIGIGVEKPPVKLASYVDLAQPSQVSRSALQRWFFVPEYQCLRVTPDGLGMELVGETVKLVGEDEVVGQNGQRSAVKQVNRASETFVTAFTKKYPELAAKLPVFAQLRNAIDLLVACAFIQQHDYYGQAGWTAELFRSEQAVPVETYNTPRQVETVVASRWKGNQLMTPVGGGVSIHPRRALESGNLLSDDEGKVDAARTAVDLKHLAADAWWWD